MAGGNGSKDPRIERWRKLVPPLYRRTDAGGQVHELSQQELELLIEVALQLDLDPVLSEVVIFQGRPYVGEMGLMKIAIRSGQLNGLTVESVFEDAGDDKGPQWITTGSIHRKDMGFPITLSVMHREYENPRNRVWQKNPRSMTEKCCVCRLIRHAFAISVTSIEEMGIDEVSGTTAEQAQAAARVETREQAGETQAAAAAEAKAEAKEQKKAEKAGQMTEDQRKAIVRLYKGLGLPREESQALFHKCHPKLPATADERVLMTSEATAYILQLRKRLTSHLAHELGITNTGVKEIAGKIDQAATFDRVACDGVNPPVFADEENWPVFFLAMKRAGAEKLAEKAGAETDCSEMDEATVDELIATLKAGGDLPAQESTDQAPLPEEAPPAESSEAEAAQGALPV